MTVDIRKPAVAGQFYAGSKDGLINQIESCFLGERGPGSLPKMGIREDGLKGVVVPHAGYVYSGEIATHSYLTVADNGFADTFIILGPNHTGIGSGISMYPGGVWETPLGKIPVDEGVVKKLEGGIIDIDKTAHIYEHSIEVQLPFLQYISDGKNFSFVPICMAMQDYETSREVGESIAGVIKSENKKIVIIASSDFSHVGFNYSTSPPSGERVDKYAMRQDKIAIDKILKLDARGLVESVYQRNITMCGYGCVASMLVAAKKLGAKKAKLLKYGNSFEVSPGSSCVGYGSIAVY